MGYLEMFKVVLSFWREALIALLLATCWFLHSDLEIKKEKLANTEQNLSQCKGDLKDVRGKLEVFEKASKDADEAHRQSEKKRLAIITELVGQVNTLRNQSPPKDCQQAIEWAIANKGDLSWKK